MSKLELSEKLTVLLTRKCAKAIYECVWRWLHEITGLDASHVLSYSNEQNKQHGSINKLD